MPTPPTYATQDPTRTIVVTRGLRVRTGRAEVRTPHVRRVLRTDGWPT